MGDGFRKIARALYERAGKEEKREARKFFKKLDLNKDERISLSEFKKGVPSELANDKVFKELESSRNRGLDFDDVLVLFYYSIKHAITIVRCHGCRQLIFGPSFSCFQCLFNPSDRRFALCCDCYGKGEFKHQHPLSSTSTSSADDLLHDRALLLKLSEKISEQPRSKKEMKKLWEDAKSENGAAASHEAEAMVDNLLKSMGDDGQNQGLDLKHFSELMIQQQESALDTFLKPSQDSDFATNFMKSEMKRVLTQSNSPPTTAIVAHNNVAATSTRDTHFVNTSNYRLDYGESSSKPIIQISTLKVVTTTFKIVEMALTIASFSSMCTIM